MDHGWERRPDGGECKDIDDRKSLNLWLANAEEVDIGEMGIIRLTTTPPRLTIESRMFLGSRIKSVGTPSIFLKTYKVLVFDN